MAQVIEVLQGGQPVNVEFHDDMSLDDIAEALQGFPTDSAAGQTFTPPAPVIPPVEEQSIFRSFADVPLKIGSGIALGVKGIAEAFGADSEVAQNIEGIEDYLDSLLSAQSRADSAEIARLQTEAQDKGFLEQAKAALKGISVAPIDFAAQTVGTALPVIAATAAAGLAGLPTAAVGIGTGSLMGTGIVKGSIFDVVEDELLKANVPPEEAEAVAQEAQSYQGGNLDQIGLGAILGAWAARSGIEPAIARMLSRNIAQRGIFQGAVVGAATEAVPEAFQGAQEQLARNLAQIREEQIEDVPLYRGVAGAGTLEGLAGGIGGGVFGAASSGAAPQPQLPTTEDLSEITQTEDIVTPDLPTTEPTPDLSEDTTLPPLEERLSLIAPNLRGTLKGRGLDDVGLELSTRLDPKALEGMNDPDDVDAIFDPDLNTIFLGADRIKGFEQMDTPQLQREFSGLVDHEMVHAVKRMNLWKDSEWKVLENAARRRTNAQGRTYMDAAISDYSKETADIQTEEAVAELIRDTLAGRTGLAGQPLSLIQRFVEFFRKMGNALTGTGYASFNQVVNDIETGVTGGRPRVAQPEAEATIIGEPAVASRGLANQARNKRGNPLGINVRQDRDGTDYASLIASGQKAYESRESRSLDPYVGKRVGLVRTGAGPASLVGYAEVGTPIEANESTLNELREEHLVPKGSTFDIKEGQTKFLYPMLNPESVAPQELPSSSRGIVARQIGEPLASRRALRQDDNRLQQAKDQGFNTDRVLYHFTDKFQFGGKEFESIIPSVAGKLGPGIYTSPDAAYSQNYLKSPEIRGSRGIAGYARGPIANQSDYQAAIDFAVDDYRSRTDDPINNVQVKRLAKEILEEQGFTGLEMEFPRGTEVVVFNPKDFRSINAEFDPRATDSPRLLASRKRLPHGLPEFLTVDSSGKKPIHNVVQNFTPSNRSKITNNITKVLENNPEALATYNAWINAEEDAFCGDKVPAPPFQAIEYAANPELLADKLNQLTPELKATVDEGFGYVNEIKDIYESGEATPELTGRLFLWGILSRGAGPVQQEAAFLNILNAATPFISKSASGNMTQTDLDSWAKTVSGILPEGSPARSVTMNVNAAGKLLFELGKTAEGSDRSVLSVLHDSLSDPSQSAADFRRKFFSLTNKPGIDNKVVSFISLVGGKPDVLVMDRIQSRHLWDDGRFDGANIYDGIKIEGRDQGTGLNEILAGPRGLLVTEMLENGLRDSVNQAYEIVGRPEDASLGRMHWETWVIEGNQGVPHSTLQAVKTGSPTGYSVTEGKRGTYTSGATFRQTENGLIVEYPLSDGTKVRMTPTQFIDFKKYISKPSSKIVPKNFKVSESTERPWYESQGVDRGALDDAARRYENANPDGTVRSSDDKTFEAGDSVSSRQRARRTGRGKLKTKPEDSAALAVDQSKAATEVRGNPEADQAAAAELQQTKKLASRSKASDIVTSTAYNRVADVASKRAARGQGNINNALPYEMPSSADDRGIVYALQDKYIDLKNATETVKANQRKLGLTPLKDIENPYLGEESMHGIIGNKFNRFQQDEVTPLAKKLVATKIPRKELEEFLVLRHAIERNENVRNLNAASKNPRPELADGGAGSLNGQRLVDSYVKSEMQNKYGLRWNDSTKSWEGGNRRAGLLNDLAGDFDAITRGTLQELKDSGLINQDSLDKLNTHYKYYAPLRGLSQDEDIAIEEHSRIARGANNLSIGGIETEKATGRVSEAMPPLGQIIFQRQNAIRRGTINDVVGQRMLNVIREHPNDNYWKIHEDRSYAGVAGKELFGVKEDGKQYFVEFKDKRLRDAMLSLDAAQTGKLLGFLRGVNRYMSAVLTSYNPDFVAPNFVRDLGTAINNLVGEQTMVGGKAIDTDGLIGKVIADVGPSVREVYRGLRGKKLNKKLEQDWKDYMESGAKTEWFHVKSPEESSRDIDDLIAMAQGTFKGNMKAGKDAIAGFVSDVNGAIENGVRFATFKNARDLFIKNGDSRAEAVAKAATLAKNLTVNFNRKGNSGELLNGLYLFFNASVQGTANFLRGMSSPAKQRMLLAMASFGSLVTYLNEMVSEEDDDGKSAYANIPSFVKERNLVLMRNINPFYEGSGDPPYTIPLPYGYNVLHVLGVNTMETILGLISPQDAAARVSAAALGSFSPVGFGTSSNPVSFAAKGLTPQIGKPIAEILLNEDFFGSPVYTEPFEFGPNIPLANLSQRSTPDFWKNTTQFMNRIPLLGPGTGGDESRAGPLGWVSPDALHHLFGTFIGGTGRFVERAGKTAAAGSDYLQGEYVEDDLSVNDIPILRRFMYESNGREGMSTYYDRKEDILAADRQAGLLKGSERGEFIRENRPLLLMKRMMESSDKRIRNINRRLAVIGEKILTSPSIEATIKLEEEQKRLEDLKLNAYNRFNKRFNERVGPTK